MRREGPPPPPVFAAVKYVRLPPFPLSILLPSFLPRPPPTPVFASVNLSRSVERKLQNENLFFLLLANDLRSFYEASLKYL